MNKTRLLVTGSVIGLMMVSVSPAFAQDATVDEAQKTQENKAIETKAEEPIGDALVVVGSRIRRDNYNSISPVQVITRDETTAAGFNSTTEALQSNSVTGGQGQVNNSFGGFVTNGGPGANTLSLRGLGATRTLILLNGRRVAPAGTRGSVGSADLNVLPSIAVDRIEILKDGASSVYGSDAVAGVVNIVTRTKMNGVDAEAQTNVPQVGAGVSRRVSIAAGKTGDRFSIMGTIEYAERNELTLGDRDFTQCQTDFRRSVADRTPGSADFIDPFTGKSKCYTITGAGNNGVTINTIGTNFRSGVAGPGTTGTSFRRFRPNANITTGATPGYEGVSVNSRDTFDKRLLKNSLVSPGKFYTGYINAAYDLGILGNAEAYVEALASRRESTQTGFRQLSLDYAVGSPLLPAFLQTSVSGTPTDITNGQNLGVRAFIGFGNDTSSQRADFVKVGGGIKGDFVFPGWRYDAFVGKTWATGSYTFESFLTDKLAQSLNVVSNGAGGFNCVNPAGGCVAAPVLNADTVGGRLPASWVDYVYKPVTGKTKFKETIANLTVDGSLFELPYGKVQAVLGVEYRRSSLNDTPPIDAQNRNLYNLTSSGITRGSDEVVEAFGEIEIPLLANIPFAKELKINVSGRYTDYRSYGSGSTYKVGGIYTPFDWISLRGTYGTSFRAPALFEQFLGGESGFIGAGNDPCNDLVDDGSIASNNCLAEGFSEGFLQTSGISVFSTGGASLGLKAETSSNFTGGLILQPKFSSSFGDLSFAVDYYKIKVKDQVAQFGGANILSLCYNDPQFKAGGGFCNFITRGADNRLTVIDNFVNLATQNVRGLDYTLRYARDLGPGRFRLNASVTQYLEQSSKLFSTDALDEVNGTIGNPKFSGSFDVSYKYREWQLRYGLDWLDATKSYSYLGLDPATTPFFFETPDYFQHSLSLGYEGDKFNMTMGVRNLLDKDPPQISQGAYSRIGNAPLFSGYDYTGRTFFINVGTSF